MTRDAIIKLAKQKIKDRLANSAKNNYYIMWKGEERDDILPKSLAIVLTKYPTDITEASE